MVEDLRGGADRTVNDSAASADRSIAGRGSGAPDGTPDGGHSRAPDGGHSHGRGYGQTGSTELVGVDRHLDRILATVRPLPAFEQRLDEAYGLLLCEDVTAGFELPPFDNSAMDGYAVRASDLVGASASHPVELPVIGDLAAGPSEPIALGPGHAVRIMTGAPIPHHADAVVPVERTDGGVARVRITEQPQPGACIRRAGEDVSAGEPLLASGQRLGAREIALLAAAGRGRVRVRPRPRVVVISTGAELRDPGEPLAPGLIHDSNSYTLAAAVREEGAIAYRVGAVPDDARRFAEVLDDQLLRADLVLTTGGVSVGAYDIVKQELGRLGTVRFDKVAMQPGMPQGFGVIGDEQVPILTLPGNPVSAYVSFQVFVKPALRQLAGLDPHTELVTGTVTEGWRSSAGKRQYARVRYEPPDIIPVSGPGSHLVAGLARSNALAIVPEDVTQVRVGDRLQVLVPSGP